MESNSRSLKRPRDSMDKLTLECEYVQPRVRSCDGNVAMRQTALVRHQNPRGRLVVSIEVQDDNAIVIVFARHKQPHRVPDLQAWKDCVF